MSGIRDSVQQDIVNLTVGCADGTENGSTGREKHIILCNKKALEKTMYNMFLCCFKDVCLALAGVAQ